MGLGKFVLSVVSNRAGWVPRPSWCTYLVCFRCNARCGMCDSWKMKPGREMTPDEVRVVFGKIGRLDVVRLTGGEPFLRDDFAEVALAVWETARPGVLHVTSNGSFPERIQRFCEQFPRPSRLRFMISLDGESEEHDANRGDEVRFEIALESLRCLAKLRDQLGLQVSVNHTVISARSLADHRLLVTRLAPLGIDVQTVLAYRDSAMYGKKRFGHKATDLIGGGYPLHPDLEGADVIGFTRTQLRQTSRMRDPLLRVGKRYYLRGLLERLEGNPKPQPHPPCVALRSHIRLLPDGSVPVCQFNTEKVGNLLEQSWEEVWDAPAARESRAWVDSCPGCWAECEVIPSALYTGDLLRHLTAR
jgi:MoaA/NifB/PqqE/SkfB family radical SAM enzyme